MGVDAVMIVLAATRTPLDDGPFYMLQFLPLITSLR